MKIGPIEMLPTCTSLVAGTTDHRSHRLDVLARLRSPDRYPVPMRRGRGDRE